jgi:hypothetical protein
VRERGGARVRVRVPCLPRTFRGPPKFVSEKKERGRESRCPLRAESLARLLGCSRANVWRAGAAWLSSMTGESVHEDAASDGYVQALHVSDQGHAHCRLPAVGASRCGVAGMRDKAGAGKGTGGRWGAER